MNLIPMLNRLGYLSFAKVNRFRKTERDRIAMLLEQTSVRVQHGADDSYFQITGKSVASVFRALRTPFNIPTNAKALVNGMTVNLDHRIWPGDHLEFVRTVGVKGAFEPDDRALLDRLVRDVATIKAMLGEREVQQRLNTLEQEIVGALGDDELKGDAIARRMKRPSTSNFRATLSGLVRRGVLGKGKKGYFVQPAGHEKN